ncbi:heparin lyase I family protein [Streptomyces luteolus]|uniref:Heparin lyase I family protein n=1 Tax=Streptomyces luteolus TaxID=3043615 RepID=A0ABT6SPQ0_9ACTN|nr:heparin lyase I family protein [Streptomyces sp. B-S-A12]MDI3417588.1 heparin lyase I family protein [Streptomyces sp. B-S-A12]
MRQRLCWNVVVLGAAFSLVTASPAVASTIWDGDAARGTGVFGGIECEAPGSVTVSDFGGTRGKVFKFNKPRGLQRCEARGVRADGDEYTFSNNSTYFFGWSTATNTDDAATIFQWKSYPNGQQNYPVLMKVEGGVLKLFHIEAGQVWDLIWSTPVTIDHWKHIALGIRTSSSPDGGWVELYYNGRKQTFDDGSQRFVGRTWDTLNKPKWGTYGAEIADKPAINWVDDLRIGTTYADVAP